MRTLLITLLLLLPLPLLAASNEKLSVVASFSILADITQQVAGDAASVTSLIPAGTDAHTYTPTPADVKSLIHADVVVLNGLGLEKPLEKLLSTDEIKGRIVTASQDVAPLLTPQHTPDPHAWMDVSNTKHYVATIRDALVQADPNHAEGYRQRAESYLARLTQLDTHIHEEVAAIPREKRRAITTHDSLHYFSNAYGLEFISAQGVSTESELSAGDMAAIISLIRTTRIPAVFLENMGNPELMKQLAEEGHAIVGGELYTDSLSPDQENGISYISIMNHNVDTIFYALIK